MLGSIDSFDLKTLLDGDMYLKCYLFLKVGILNNLKYFFNRGRGRNFSAHTYTHTRVHTHTRAHTRTHIDTHAHAHTHMHRHAQMRIGGGVWANSWSVG